MSADTMMDSEVANPLRMLSAYLMTTAMTSPPTACRQENTLALRQTHNTTQHKGESVQEQHHGAQMRT